MDDNKWADMVITEIQQLREDMREDVNVLHGKIGDKFDKISDKLDEKIETQNIEIKKKVPMTWYKYTLYAAIIVSLAMGGSTVANQVSNAKIGTKVEDHIKHDKENTIKLEKKIDEIDEHIKVMNGGKHAKEK